MADSLHVGLLAPVTRRLPPRGYGPWEQVCHDLAEALVSKGHRVTLYAAPGSESSAEVVSFIDGPIDDPTWWGVGDVEDLHDPGPDARVLEQMHIAGAVEHAAAGGLDILHSHLHVHAMVFSSFTPTPVVSTLHGSGWNRAHHPVLRRYSRHPIVSISDSERRFVPGLNYVATVHNGIDVAGVPVGDGGDGLLFAGRIAPEKAPHLAIEVAERSGRDLTIAGPIDAQHIAYFESRIRPALRHSTIDYIGDLDREELLTVMGRSGVTVMPLLWDEPFGLVAVESMATGTPVVGWRRGALVELIESGISGLLVDSTDRAAVSVEEAVGFSRTDCRSEAVRRFDRSIMAAGYEAAYRSVMDDHTSAE